MAIIDADSNRVIGNTIGTNILQNRSLQNGELGVWLLNASGNEIGGSLPDEGNVISGNGHWGVEIYDANSIGNRIAGNWIGIDSGGRWALPNLEGGVYIHNGARQNQIGPSNRIRFNGGIGVCVHMEDAKYNTITQNSISDNASEGILLLSGGNGEIHPPSVQWTADGIAGTAAPNATVEIFSDPASQGLTFEGFVTADGDGNFSWTGTPSGPFVTATATDPSGNTSPFSAAVGLSGADDARPESARMFTLSQNFPNPFNPSTAIRFSLKESCRLVLRIFDLRGHEVSKLADGKFGPGEHTVRFDASGLPSGIYVVRIRAGDFVAARKMVKVE
jgi:parallel beta-helix repeat protein